MVRRKKILAFILILFFVTSAYAGYRGVAILAKLNGEKVGSLEEPKKGEKVNILIVGIDSGNFIGNRDRTNDIGRTDTIMVGSLDMEKNTIKFLSIPRDSRVAIPGRGMDKINHAHAFGGMDLTVRTVQGLLGVPIHHYVRINFDAFVAIVEALDGVTIEVEKSDLAGAINLDPRYKLTPGVQKLDPEHAFQYVRIRNDDISRVKRQQKFIKAVLKEALQVGNIFKSPAIVQSVADHLETDMSVTQMIKYAGVAQGFSENSLETEILHGKPANIKGVSYWQIDEEKKEQIVNNTFK